MGGGKGWAFEGEGGARALRDVDRQDSRNGLVRRGREVGSGGACGLGRGRR